MPIQKFKTFEEAEMALINLHPDAAYFARIAALWDFADKLNHISYPRGIFKFKTIEEANQQGKQPNWSTSRTRTADYSQKQVHEAVHFISKGNITEAFVGQELLAYAPPHQKAGLYYWQRESRGSNADLDYLIQQGGQIVPVEVAQITQEQDELIQQWRDETINNDKDKWTGLLATVLTKGPEIARIASAVAPLLGKWVIGKRVDGF